MNKIKRYGLLVAGVLLLSGALLVGAFALPAAAQTGPRGGQATNGAGMMGGAGGMMGAAGSTSSTGAGMMGAAGGMMNGAGGMMGNVDRHFIEAMIPHHQTAVDMADLALQKAQHPEVKTLAAAIKQAQTAEIAQMRTWYRQWYGTDVPATSSSGMGSMMTGGMMNGCSGMRGDVSDLRNAADFDKAFLEQMIPHHEMALMMSNMVLAQGARPELQTLARSIISSQTAEITQMRGWYEQWYGTATP